MNNKSISFKQLFQDKQTRLQVSFALIVLVVGLSMTIAGFVELQAISHERLYLETQKNALSLI